MHELVLQHPTKDWYMLVDEDTIVFKKTLRALLHRLTHDVLAPRDDLFMGHVVTNGMRLQGRPPLS